MMFRPLAAATAVLFACGVQAAPIGVSLSADGFGFETFEYTQDFNALSATNGTATIAWVNDSTLEGWSLFDSKQLAKTTYRASNGSDSSGSFYSYGLDSDRALGAVGAGTAYWGTPASSALSGYVALALRNDSGRVLEGISLYWDAEQWRMAASNAGSDALDFRYGVGASFADVSTWTNPGVSFKYNSPVSNTTTGAGAPLDGNANAVALGGDIALDWQPGQTLWVTWIDYNSAGNDHGLAIDNVLLSVAVPAVPEPGALALLAAGLGIVGAAVRRQRA